MSIETRIDQLCDKFEDAWNAGKSPSMGKVLEKIPATHHATILKRLIPVDVELRMQAGLSVVSDDYAAFGPAAVDLATQTIEKLAPTTESPLPDDVLNQPTIIGPGNEQSPSVNLTESQILDSFHKVTRPQGTSPVIGPYKILQKIAEGGMGIVFMAEQTQPVRRRVALKLIKAGMDSKDIITRFEAERQALALMDHPNIAKVLDAGTTKDGRPYFVMELVQGIPVTEYCDKQKLSVEDRLELFTQTCRAIQHAHQKGIIHRDIKPSNVLVTQHDGVPSVKVIDFGLAKALQSAARLTDKTMFTEFGQVVGTLQYMSPEQAEMNALDVDTRSDVYSLGVLLYELLTGSTPIEKQRLKEMALDRVLAAIRDEEAPRPSTRLSSLGDSATGISDQRRTDPRKLGLILKGDLDWITVKALEKDRTRRYDSPVQLAEDVQRFLCNEAITARPPSFGYIFARTVRRNKGTVIAVSTIMLALLLGLVGTSTMWLRARNAEAAANDDATKARDAESQERAAKLEVTKERDRANERDDASKRLLYAARMNLAQAAWKDAHVDRAAQLISHYSPSSDSSNLIGFEWHYWNRLFQHGFRIWNGHKERTQCVAFSPDGKRVVSASTDKTAKVWDIAENKEVLTIVGHTDIVRSVAFHPNGELIATASYDKSVRLWDSTSGELRMTLEGHTDKLLFVAFSPDGCRLVSTSNDGVVIVWDTVSGKSVFVKTTGSFGVRCGAFSPDGTRLAIGCYGNRMAMLDATNGAELRMFIGHALVVTSVCFSPNGSQIASGSWDQSIKIWDPETGKELKSLRGHEAEVTGVTYHPDGARIASSSFDRTIRIWNVNEGFETHRLVGHRHLVFSVALSRDGTTVASCGADSSVRLWKLDTDPEREVLSGHGGGWSLSGYTGSVFCVTFGLDGTQFASGGGDGSVKLWDAATGTVIRSLDGHQGAVRSIAFSPDRREVATAGDDSTVRLWDSETGVELSALKGHTGAVQCVAYSPDGHQIASVGDDHKVILWNREVLQKERSLEKHSASVSSVAFSPDGRFLAAGSMDGGLILWNVGSWESTRVTTGHTGEISDICFDNDSARIATASADNTARVWDIRSSRTVLTLSGVGRCYGVAFTPDGRRVITASGNVKVWDAQSGQETLALRGTKGAQAIYGIDISPDGSRIVASNGDKEIILWDSQP